MYDGLATEHVNLNALRNHMTISKSWINSASRCSRGGTVPQQPDLLSGTIRDNLDPFGEYDDAVLNDALRSSGLDNIQTETEEERITLDTSVSSGGGNFSLGQRQIIALARAICRRSKVLILDEGE
jgi:ABC-type multidrug transport system fused ATPase/permease subunit